MKGDILNMKSKILILIISLLVVIILLVLPWGKFAISSIFSKEPPKPKHQYGEFPFLLTYQIKGKQFEVKDTLVIEYLGVGYNEGLGKYNKWNTYYKSSQTTDKTLEIFNEYVEGIGTVIISYKLGSCEYYMGLDETEELYKSNEINPGDIVISSPNGTRKITDDELYSSFKIRIIEKSVSSPLA